MSSLAISESDKMSTATLINRRIAGGFDLFMMNLGIMLSGMMTQWHSSLPKIGAGEYLISLMLCSIAYLCLALCIAEICSIIAFSGGSYGYSRCALSPFIGYIVGMCDLLQSVLFTAICVYKVAEAMSMLVSGNEYWEYLPGWIVAVYSFILLISLPGGRCFWVSMAGFTIMTVILLLIYCIGNAPRFDFPAYAAKEYPLFAGASYDFMKEMIAPAICFVGLDFITLFTDEAKNPQRDLPHSLIGAVIFTIIMAFWVTLTAISINPGVTNELTDDKIVFVTYFGLRDLFEIDYAKANFLIAPTLFSGASGYLFSAGRQMNSMSKSGLLPQCFSITYGANQVPIAAMLTTSLLGVITLFPLWAANPQSKDVYSLAMIGASVVYLSMFWCYLLFKWSYSSMDRQFTNPLGSASAIFGIIYFTVVMISLIFVQLNYRVVVVFVPLMIIAIVYYYKVVESRQFFSKEEQQKFMKAYILNANRKKKKMLSPHMKRMRKVYLGLNFDSLFGSWNLSPAQGGSFSASSGGLASSVGSSSAIGSRKSDRSTQGGSSGRVSIAAPGSPLKTTNSMSRLEEHDVIVGSITTSNSSSYKVVPVSPFPVSTTAIVSPSGMTDQQVVAEIGKIKAIADVESSIHFKLAPIPPPEVAPDDDKLTWSGKLLDDNDSRKVFQIMLNHEDSHTRSHSSLHAASTAAAKGCGNQENVTSNDLLVEQYPEQFSRTAPSQDLSQKLSDQMDTGNYLSMDKNQFLRPAEKV